MKTIKTKVFILLSVLMVVLCSTGVLAYLSWGYGIDYKKGDKVTWGGYDYECIKNHKSDDLNQPPSEYWKLLPKKTPTPAISPTPVITPTPVPPPNTIKVQFFNQSTAATINQIYLNFKLINTGTSAINLSNVQLRYYYTVDGTQSQTFYCDWSSVGSDNVTGNFVTISTPKTGADTYLEIGFISSAGILELGSNVTITARFAKNDWSSYTQTDDYSFNSSATSYVDWIKTTGYISGVLQWGIEP